MMEIKLPPEPKYEVYPFNTTEIVIKLTQRPNLWVRFWMWFIFNWKFKKIKGEKESNKH